jgi:peptide chain release factor 1
MLPEQKLDALLDRHALVEREMATGLAAEAYVKLSREFAELSPVIGAINRTPRRSHSAPVPFGP